MNVSITRVRPKTIVFLPLPLIEPPVQAFEDDGSLKVWPLHRGLVQFAECEGETSRHTWPAGATLTVHRVARDSAAALYPGVTTSTAGLLPSVAVSSTSPATSGRLTILGVNTRLRAPNVSTTQSMVTSDFSARSSGRASVYRQIIESFLSSRFCQSRANPNAVSISSLSWARMSK